MWLRIPVSSILGGTSRATVSRTSESSEEVVISVRVTLVSHRVRNAGVREGDIIMKVGTPLPFPNIRFMCTFSFHLRSITRLGLTRQSNKVTSKFA